MAETKLAEIKLNICRKNGREVERRETTILVSDENREDVDEALTNLFYDAKNIAQHPSASFFKKYGISIDIDMIYDSGKKDNFRYENEKATWATFSLMDNIVNNGIWLM